ncbi:hypothetical protein Tco_0301564, partial [Tanacetum coccineum]
LLVQVYVDDIIFGSTKKELCNAFKKLTHEIFQMSSIRELTFFLGLQVYRSQDPKSSHDDGSKPSSDDGKKVDEDPRKDNECNDQEKEDNVNIINNVNAASTNEVNPFDLVVYTDSDYAGASLDRKSTIGGCQFLIYRLISWQCKKQTVVANSIT